MKHFILIILALGLAISAQAKTYQNRDPVACLETTFTCPSGQYPFFDQQGCGCYRPKACDAFPEADNTFDTAMLATDFSLLSTDQSGDVGYISRDFALCRQLRFACTVGFYPFFNTQGCGCATISNQVQAYCEPAATFQLYAALTAEPYYISEDAAACEQLRFRCKESDFYPFFNQDGCGCRAQVCPEAARYFISQDTAECQRIRFKCRQGFEAFTSELGCGCVPVTTVVPSSNTLEEI